MMKKDIIRRLWLNCDSFLAKATLASVLTDKEKELLCVVINEEERKERNEER